MESKIDIKEEFNDFTCKAQYAEKKTYSAEDIEKFKEVGKLCLMYERGIRDSIGDGLGVPNPTHITEEEYNGHPYIDPVKMEPELQLEHYKQRETVTFTAPKNYREIQKGTVTDSVRTIPFTIKSFEAEYNQFQKDIDTILGGVMFEEKAVVSDAAIFEERDRANKPTTLLLTEGLSIEKAASEYDLLIERYLDAGEFASAAHLYAEKETEINASQKAEVFRRASELIGEGKDGKLLFDAYLSERSEYERRKKPVRVKPFSGGLEIECIKEHAEIIDDIKSDTSKYDADVETFLETGDFASAARTYLEKEKATKTSQKEDVFEKAYELITGGKEGLFLLERYLSGHLQYVGQERVSVAKKTKFRRKKPATYDREINKCLETNSFASAARTYMEMEIATGEIQETRVYQTASKLICEGKVKTGMRLLNSYFSERKHYIEYGDVTHKKKKTASEKHKSGSKKAPYESWWKDFDRKNEWIDWRKNLQSESELQ